MIRRFDYVRFLEAVRTPAALKTKTLLTLAGTAYRKTGEREHGSTRRYRYSVDDPRAVADHDRTRRTYKTQTLKRKRPADQHRHHSSGQHQGRQRSEHCYPFDIA